MKSGLAAIIGLVIMTFTSTATAYVVEVTTSIPVATAADDARLKDALESAISDVLHQLHFFYKGQLSIASLCNGRTKRKWDAMLNLESGDRIELFYEDSPGSDNSRDC